jgi:hypothetical protein
MANIPEYNQIDIENDTLTVVRAKVEALVKALRKRAAANKNEEEEIGKMLGKPLGEWP